MRPQDAALSVARLFRWQHVVRTRIG